MHRKVSLFAFLGITILLFVLPSSAGSDLTPSYDNLFLWLTIVSAAVFILVVVVWIYVIKTYNEKNTEVDRTPMSHETARKLEFGWTAVAILIVLILMGLSYPVLFNNTNKAQTEHDGYQIVVEGTSSWTWKYHLQNGDVISPVLGKDGSTQYTNITLTVGTKYTFILYNTAGFIHSYYVPDLNIKMDVVPGVNNTITFTIAQPGHYELMCAEYCGPLHSTMRGFVNAEA